MPFKIAIVGAGLGGLTAALCLLRQKGDYDIRIFEKHTALSHRGSGIMIRPGASRILAALGDDLRNALDAMAENNTMSLLRSVDTGEIAMRSILVDISVWPDWNLRREEIQAILYGKIIEAGVDIEFSAEVENVVERQTKVELFFQSGAKEADFDLVIGADGIRSKIRNIVFGGQWEPKVTNMTLYGVKLDWELLAEDTATCELIRDNNLNVWMGKDIYLTSSASSKNGRWSGLFGVVGKTDQRSLWDEAGDIAYVKKHFSGACQQVRKALDLTDECDRWRIAEMPDLPQWTSKSGRVILLGDSAHGMVPNAAQGFSQTVEDIGVLCFLLQSLPNSTIPVVTKAWEEIRKPRVERIKAYARWNSDFFTGQSLVQNGMRTGTAKSLKAVVPDKDASFHSAAFNKWVLDHDVIAEAKTYIEQARAKL